MTTQEAYEKIRAWLTRPNAERAWSEDRAQCLYDTGNGNRCAVGILLTDETLFEDGANECIEAVEGLIASIDPPELRDVDQKFLVVAQNLHDHERHWDEEGRFRVERLDEAAKWFGLEVVKS